MTQELERQKTGTSSRPEQEGSRIDAGWLVAAVAVLAAHVLMGRTPRGYRHSEPTPGPDREDQ